MRLGSSGRGPLNVILGVAVAGLVTLAPAISRACSVCTAGRDEENALAFLLSTIFMSLLPLLAIGTLVFVIWRRLQKLERETEAAREASLPTSAAGMTPAPVDVSS